MEGTHLQDRHSTYPLTFCFSPDETRALTTDEEGRGNEGKVAGQASGERWGRKMDVVSHRHAHHVAYLMVIKVLAERGNSSLGFSFS